MQLLIRVANTVVMSVLCTDYRDESVFNTVNVSPVCSLIGRGIRALIKNLIFIFPSQTEGY